MSARFKLPCGAVFLCDEADVPVVMSRPTWCRHPRGIIHHRTNTLFHRLLLGVKRGQFVHFRDGDLLNCQRSNLLVTNQSEMQTIRANDGTKNVRRRGGIYPITKTSRSRSVRVFKYPYVAVEVSYKNTRLRRYFRAGEKDGGPVVATEKAKLQLAEWFAIIEDPDSYAGTVTIGGAEVRSVDVARGDVCAGETVVMPSEVSAFMDGLRELAAG